MHSQTVPRLSLRILIVALALMVLIATPAWAGGWVDCGPGGLGKTRATNPDGWHWHHFGSSSVNVEAYQTIYINHGTHYGSTYWDVTEPQEGESGWCFV